MNEVEKINTTISLQERKEKLEAKLSSVNEAIELNQTDCSHVGVYMGNFSDGNGCKCILCNCNLDANQMLDLASRKLVIFTHNNYLTRTNATYMGRFEKVQTMFLGLCRVDEFLSIEELVASFQGMINASVEAKRELTEKGMVKELKK